MTTVSKPLSISMFFSLSMLLLLLTFSQYSIAAKLTLERNAQAALDQTYAAMRAQQLSNVSYQLSMEVDEQKPSFSGEVAISFTLAKANNSPVTLDFEGGEILSVNLNGNDISFQAEKWFLRFPPQQFNVPTNTLRIKFTHAYANAGDGLHRYKDAATGNVYLYSNFEPFNAHKMFPHFDQPNIKANFTLDVIAPASWQVVSTTREISITNVNEKKHWQFPATPKMASYVFSMHAGPYTVWEDNSGAIPLRLFARQEVAQYVDYKEWFLFTQQSFAFFNNYFSLPYPFKKYDQLIVPDFNSGAMENIGAVTFNEFYVGRGKKTDLERMKYGNVIAHEMAHMWFGDLVTMSWWNGLWLNESFATYMSYLAQEKSSQFGEKIWDVFFIGTKQWAYTSDQQVTTHPIELSVDNTAEAFANFDGITYGKGASVLKQLAYYVGEENFRKGVVKYLKKYSYSNTQLVDFMSEIAKASQRDLSDWAYEWLYQAGLNSIQLHYTCEQTKQDDIVQSMLLTQSAPDAWPILRRQKIQVGLFNLQDETLVSSARFPLVYRGVSTPINAADKLPCPAFAYPNIGDMGYAKVMLDEKSLSFIKNHFASVDASLRLMLWQNLWDSVLDVKMPLSDYLQFVNNYIGIETRSDLISAVTAKLKSTRDYLWLMSNEHKTYAKELALIETIAYRQLLSAESASDVQKIWFDAFLQAAHTPEALAKIHAIVVGEETLQGFVVDQDRRWMMLIRLNQFQTKNYLALTKAEQQQDRSDTGQQMALACEAIRPDASIKVHWFQRITAKEKNDKLAALRVVMGNLLPFNQRELRADMAGSVLENLQTLSAVNDDRFMFAFLGTMLPRACNPDNLQALQQAHELVGYLSPALNRSLLVGAQEEQRCIDMKKIMR
jgi:aminopeptidase N